MKTILTIYLCLVLWLLAFPAHGSTHYEWLIVCRPGETWEIFQVTDHFRWEWGAGSYHPVERIDVAEGLVQAVIRENRISETAAVPEPSTMLLLASGLAALAIRRKR